MKNLFKKSALLLMLFITVGMSSKSMFDDIIVSTLNTKTINLQLSNTDGDLEVFIKDAYGILLYEEVFKGEVLSKKFNLGLLPDGNYTVEIAGQTKINTIPLKIENSIITVLNSDKEVVYRPIVRVNGDLVFISKFAQLEEKLAISLYDGDTKLYDGLTKGKMDVSKVLNIKNLPKGTYKLVLNYGGRTQETMVNK